jgi:hypothetical protein
VKGKSIQTPDLPDGIILEGYVHDHSIFTDDNTCGLGIIGIVVDLHEQTEVAYSIVSKDAIASATIVPHVENVANVTDIVRFLWKSLEGRIVAVSLLEIDDELVTVLLGDETHGAITLDVNALGLTVQNHR